jgi:hypothetical protein
MYIVERLNGGEGRDKTHGDVVEVCRVMLVVAFSTSNGTQVVRERH